MRRHAASTVDHRGRVGRLFLLAGLDVVIAMLQYVNTSARQRRHELLQHRQQMMTGNRLVHEVVDHSENLRALLMAKISP